MSTVVARRGWREATAPTEVRVGGRARRASATQDGQWNPTGAGTMHSGHTGRPQRVQVTRVSRLGCR
jgi:hypothetical protein